MAVLGWFNLLFRAPQRSRASSSGHCRAPQRSKEGSMSETSAGVTFPSQAEPARPSGLERRRAAPCSTQDKFCGLEWPRRVSTSTIDTVSSGQVEPPCDAERPKSCKRLAVQRFQGKLMGPEVANVGRCSAFEVNRCELSLGTCEVSYGNFAQDNK